MRGTVRIQINSSLFILHARARSHAFSFRIYLDFAHYYKQIEKWERYFFLRDGKFCVLMIISLQSARILLDMGEVLLMILGKVACILRMPNFTFSLCV